MRANLSHVSEPDTDRQSPFASLVLQHLHLGWRWKDKFSIFVPHRTSLATDYRESNLTLDTWEKVRSKGLSVFYYSRGYKDSSVVALIRNAAAGYWWPGSSDKVAILAEAGHRRHHTTTGQRSSTSTSLIPIQWSALTHHNDVMPFQIST